MTRSWTWMILAVSMLALVPACGDDVTNTTNNVVAGPDWPPSGTGVALGGSTLHLFSLSAPTTFTDSIAVSGLDAGYALVAIDYRPATGQFYGVGVNGANGRLYAINVFNGTAVSVGGSDFSTTLTSARFGSDFNPVVDRLRVVEESGTNQRVNPNTGALAGADTALNPGLPAVNALAYTNNTVGTATTTVYGIDRTAATLVLIGGVDGTPSPNGGTLTTIGALGVTPDTADVGFDITPSGTAYASISVSNAFGLYTINLTTGAATLVGTLATGTVLVRDIAIVP